MSTNNKTIIALVLLAVTAAFSTASVSTNYGTPGKFQGTYYNSPDGRGVTGVITIHADGTVSSVLGDMFAFSAARDNRRSTPARGVWRKVGTNKIRVTIAFFLTEQFGDAYSEGGVIARVSFLAEFNRPEKGRYPGYTTTDVVAEAFLPTQNPNTDAPISVMHLGDGMAYRMEPK
jgi:hypothetical protein